MVRLCLATGDGVAVAAESPAGWSFVGVRWDTAGGDRGGAMCWISKLVDDPPT